MSQVKFNSKNLHDYIDRAKTEYRRISNPLEDMEDNFSDPQRIGMAYFQAALAMINELVPDNSVVEKIVILTNDLDTSTIQGE